MKDTNDTILRYILAFGMLISCIIVLILTFGATDLGVTNVVGLTIDTSQFDTLLTLLVFGIGITVML